MTALNSLINRVHHADCFDLLAMIPDGTVDAIITDLPYQVTAMKWDVIIPFEPMWAAVKRVLKPRGVFVTTASQPFTSALVMSNPKWFREALVWNKRGITGFLDSRRKHLKQHEDVLIFCEGQPAYFPMMTEGVYRWKITAKRHTKVYGGFKDKAYYNNTYYPKSILVYPSTDQTDKQHPTQKPVALYEYLIRTYTQPGELVLDFCAGSGTTAVAARNAGRRYIAGDSSLEYVEIARKRLVLPYTPNMFDTLAAGD